MSALDGSHKNSSVSKGPGGYEGSNLPNRSALSVQAGGESLAGISSATRVSTSVVQKLGEDGYNMAVSQVSPCLSDTHGARADSASSLRAGSKVPETNNSKSEAASESSTYRDSLVVENLQIALDAAILRCSQLEKEVHSLREENSNLRTCQPGAPTTARGRRFADTLKSYQVGNLATSKDDSRSMGQQILDAHIHEVQLEELSPKVLDEVILELAGDLQQALISEEVRRMAAELIERKVQEHLPMYFEEKMGPIIEGILVEKFEALAEPIEAQYAEIREYRTAYKTMKETVNSLDDSNRSLSQCLEKITKQRDDAINDLRLFRAATANKKSVGKRQQATAALIQRIEVLKQTSAQRSSELFEASQETERLKYRLQKISVSHATLLNSKKDLLERIVHLEKDLRGIIDRMAGQLVTGIRFADNILDFISTVSHRIDSQDERLAGMVSSVQGTERD
ncbi:hypothetical protein BJ508DRAFT_344590 [Ascobolus immersus RN42]|uniref:Uncharacterized protein n=1 Tax=Ascobolus immersus RN42 TaxID=1160509 RepID=A0A3N4HCS4_ASCIM|nr:hypothetical protein BJ508DRAFT_344590 [Ascobolus immersus RN42]